MLGPRIETSVMIVGLIVALERYMQRDHDAEIARWQVQVDYVAQALRGLPGLETRCRFDRTEHLLPQLEVIIDIDSGIEAHALVQALENGNPRVFVFEPTGPTAAPNSIVVNPHALQPGEERIVADALAVALVRDGSR